MKYYIATVWQLSAMAEVVDGWQGITRHIVRRRAVSREEFRQAVLNPFFDQHVDNRAWIGPISVSKNQEDKRG